MEYASKNGIFSPDGRIIPVEYAQNASAQGNTIIIKVEDDSITVVYENRQSDPLLIQKEDRIKKLDVNREIYLIYSGLKPDSLQITNNIINSMGQYRYNTGEDMNIAQIAQEIGRYKQQFTVTQSFRPLGLRTVLFGIDEDGPAVYVIETDGNMGRYTMCSVGFKSDEVMDFVESKKGDVGVYEAMRLVMRKDLSQIFMYRLSGEGLERMSDESLREEMGRFE